MKKEEDKLDSLEVIRILESGTDDELEKLRFLAGQELGAPVSKEFVLFRRALAQQKRRLVGEGDEEMRLREQIDPKATDTELQLGVYKEHLEKPVRNAVLRLREKGYSSFESGFQGLEKQNITFETPIPELERFSPSEQLKNKLNDAGARLFVQSNSVGFVVTRLLSDEILTDLWDTLATELPSLQKPQPLTQIPTAIRFREKQTPR
jgi:hypothetical protein